MDVQGNLNLFPTAVPGSYSSGWASGGYIADSRVTGQVSLGGQQQWLSRNSQFGSWTGSDYNYVFSGVNGVPAQSFPTPSDTTLATSPVTREEPFLYLNSSNELVEAASCCAASFLQGSRLRILGTSALISCPS